jgi:hypothetical protein
MSHQAREDGRACLLKAVVTSLDLAAMRYAAGPEAYALGAPSSLKLTRGSP